MLFTSAPDVAEWAASRTGRFITREYPHLTQVGGGPQSLSECLEEKKPPAMPGIEIWIVHTHISTNPCYIMYHTVSWPREISILPLLKLLTTVIYVKFNGHLLVMLHIKNNPLSSS